MITKASKAAFTLIELMLVITILGVLVALMMPTVAQAWKVAAMTKCQVNLNRMWTAQNLRRADNDSTTFTASGVWPAMLAPYLENSADVFRCPLGPDRPELTPMVTTDAEPYATVGAGTVADQGASSTVSENARGFTISDLTFRMYCKHWSGYADGQYLGTAFADASYGIERKDLGGGKVYYGVDDRSFFTDHSVAAGNLDYRDIRFNVQFVDNRIAQIEFIGSDNGTGSSYTAFRFEVWLGDEMICDDFVAKEGMVFGSDSTTGGSGGTGGTGGTTGGTTADQPGGLNELAAIKSFDYALNKGTYRILDRAVGSIDPRSILILDYGKSVANYSNKMPDMWSLYFTATEDEWMANPLNVSFLKRDDSWLTYTALRHFGMANVLFCDGHIETLGPDALAETSPLWGIVSW